MSLYKKLIESLIFDKYFLTIKGYCPICEQKSRFSSTESWLRENLICEQCKSLPRERALMLIMDKYYPNWRELEIHESSPCSRGVSLKLKNECKNYIVSHYFPDHQFGSIVHGFRNENLEKQSFPDESLDLIITQDVLEHIYNPADAFKEIARTLKKGGAHIFTVPIANKHHKTEVWALKGENGKPVFLNEPEYHGNPSSSEPSPVATHWGYDIIEFIRTHAKMGTEIFTSRDACYGIEGDIEVLMSIKKDS